MVQTYADISIILYLHNLFGKIIKIFANYDDTDNS